MKLIALCLAVSLTFVQGTESEAWNAADALKKKADYAKAAEAFEVYAATYSESPRAVHSQVEAGVCWFSAGRAAQTMRRNTPASAESFTKALAWFDKVIAEHPTETVASRAAHMRGSTFLFSGDFDLAEAAYTRVLEEFPYDRSYVEKALEYRGMTRRHKLATADAIADMERFLKEFPKAARIDSVRRSLEAARTFGKQAPAYKPERWISGSPAPLELLGGHVVALYFWATWCPNCAKEEPIILDLARRYAERGVVFVGVTDRQKDQTADAVKRHVTEHDYPFPVFQDGGATSLAYRVTNVPHLVLIDTDGNLRWSDTPGNLNERTLEILLEPPAPKTGEKSGG